MSPDFQDRFSVRYDNTFAQVFPHYTRQVITGFNPWAPIKGHQELRNALYIYYDRPWNNDPQVYTDDLNTYSLDRQ